MLHARWLLAVLFLVSSWGGTRLSIAAEDTSHPSTTTYEVKVLAQVAAALVEGRDAIQDLRGPPIENSNLDRLNLATPGMDCGIDRVPMFIVCHSVSLNKEDAQAMFARMIDYGQAGLVSEGWIQREKETVTYGDLIRSITYQHLKSGARIDLDLVVYGSFESKPLYGVRFFGWPRF